MERSGRKLKLQYLWYHNGNRKKNEWQQQAYTALCGSSNKISPIGSQF